MKLLTRLFSRRPVPKAEEQIAALIEGFANGRRRLWDWAYFITTDFERKWAQNECFKVEEDFTVHWPSGLV